MRGCACAPETWKTRGGWVFFIPQAGRNRKKVLSRSEKVRFTFQKAHTVYPSRSSEETETTQQSGEVSYQTVLNI